MRHMASAATRTPALAAACTMRLGSKPRLAAISMALVCAPEPSYQSLSVAVAVTTPSTYGSGRSANTRCHRLSVLTKGLDASAMEISHTVVGTMTLALRSVLLERCFNTFISIRRAARTLRSIVPTFSLAIHIHPARSNACVRFRPRHARSVLLRRVTISSTTAVTIGTLITRSAAAPTR